MTPITRRPTFPQPQAARPRERALIALLAFTGMRPGEVYALDWQAIDRDAARINARSAGRS